MESEILVHVSAPSGPRDDARYRAQVAAILEFQSVSRVLVSNTSSQDSDPLDHASSQELPNSHNISPEVIPVSSSESRGSNHEELNPARAGEALQDALSTLSSDHDGPEQDKDDLTNMTSGVSTARDQPESLESPITVIPDSQPEHDPSDPASPSQDAAQKIAEISTTPEKGAPVSKRRRIDPGSLATQAIVHPTPVPQCVPTETAQIHTQCPQPSSTLQSPPQPISESKDHHLLLPLLLPLEIRAPLPPVSNASFVSHITPTLAMLTDRLKPARTYKPTRQSRDLDPLERGYWAVRINVLDASQEQQDQYQHQHEPKEQQQKKKHSHTPDNQTKTNCYNWPAPVFHRFWTFLSDFIARDGRAGWGVWCILERADAIPPGPDFDPSQDSNPNSGPHICPPSITPALLKVYAWGEVAMHIYLLLFLASERRIRGMGVQWRDAREDVVIKMP
ncbi:hypothetical protein NUU61_006026 [Penicillium alfredii]|uniref:Uncharacterized protein n=1 Tax=Penicillium alfredii TaxID=1506179 RepID=A0A9W9K3D1_9EURO|nr:uncharacterized protein NUU61_006026 [Penicillium alfredii]KAJ5091156.1 hypothetical protein NUU61_006026 [Penicillium alfredii]